VRITYKRKCKGCGRIFNTKFKIKVYCKKTCRKRKLPNYKSGEHITWDGKTISLRSSYEFVIARILDEHEIEYEYETLEIPYKYKNRTRKYIPDFYLPKYNLICEAKNPFFLKIHAKQIKAKTNAAKKLKYNFVLISEIKGLELKDIIHS